MTDPPRAADHTSAKPSAGALLLVGCAGVLFSFVAVFIGVCSVLDNATFSISLVAIGLIAFTGTVAIVVRAGSR